MRSVSRCASWPFARIVWYCTSIRQRGTRFWTQPGVGALKLAASQAVGPSGRVIAIDSADNMLASLDAKVRQFGIANIDMHSMDAAQLDFRRDYFQHTVCALRLCWLSDPRAACAEWVRVTRPGGSVNLAVLAPQAFQPQAGLLQQRVARLVGSSGARLPWAHLASPDVLRSLLADAGLVDVRVHSEQLGYHSE